MGSQENQIDVRLTINDDGWGAKRTFKGMVAPTTGTFYIFRERSTRADGAVELPSDVVHHTGLAIPAP